ncbi:MAG: hypothetical protein JXL84_01875 [Deltaproteobacteria bacterium]|nr:hypothetical protein [Deltaproteobacteria bacterium]
MMIDPYAVAIRPQFPTVDLEKLSEPEEPRPVEGSAESLDPRFDINRERARRDRRLEEGQRESRAKAEGYDAKGHPVVVEPPEVPSPENIESLDLLV